MIKGILFCVALWYVYQCGLSDDQRRVAHECLKYGKVSLHGQIYDCNKSDDPDEL